MLDLETIPFAVATLALVASILPVFGVADAQAEPAPAGARSDRAASLLAAATEPAGHRATSHDHDH